MHCRSRTCVGLEMVSDVPNFLAAILIYERGQPFHEKEAGKEKWNKMERRQLSQVQTKRKGAAFMREKEKGQPLLAQPFHVKKKRENEAAVSRVKRKEKRGSQFM